MVAVHLPGPGSGFAPQVAERGDSSLTEALAAEQADLDLHLIQPASVFGRVMYREPVPQPAAVFFPEPLHYRFATVGTEIVHDQMDGVGPWRAVRDLQQVIGELGRAAVRNRFGEVPSRLRLHATEHIGRAATLVL